jgi:hypothetical protein
MAGGGGMTGGGVGRGADRAGSRSSATSAATRNSENERVEVGAVAAAEASGGVDAAGAAVEEETRCAVPPLPPRARRRL